MSARTDKLDLASFERSHADENVLNDSAGDICTTDQLRRAADQYAALFAECKRQREEIAKLREALEAVQAGFADGSIKWARKRQADTDPYHPANVLMCAALGEK